VDPSPRVEVLRGVDGLDQIGADLDDLLAATNAPVTARRDWLATCAREHHDDPFVVAVRDAGTLVAAAPLARERRRGGIARVVGMGHGVSDRSCLPARDERAAAALADAIVDVSTSWGRPWQLRIEQLPHSDPTARAISQRFPFTTLVAGDPCPVLPFDRGREPDTYETSKLGKQVRSGRNRLQTDNRTFQVETFMSVADVERSLPEVREVHRARDRELGRPSDLDDPAGLRLWDELVLDHARKGEIEVVLLRVDRRLAAYGVVFLDGPAYRVWDARIDSQFGRYAPGHLLGRTMLDAALAHDEITSFDWGRGTEPYKRLIADELEERDDLFVWSSRLARRVTEDPRRARRWAAGLLDRHPKLRRSWVWLKRRTVAR
jgi:CelD/BcsL family acetyltransferase involved in cellulose biosynthesis